MAICKCSTIQHTLKGYYKYDATIDQSVGLVPRLQTPVYIHDSLVPRLVCEPGNEATYMSEEESTYLLTNR